MDFEVPMQRNIKKPCVAAHGLLMPSLAVAAATVLCRQERPTDESIKADLEPFLADLRASPQLGTGLLSNLARRRKLRHVNLVLKQMEMNGCEVNAFHYGVSISALDWKQALRLLRQMDARRVEQNTVTFSSCISSMERCNQWMQGLELLTEMTRRQLQKNVITVSAGITACAKAEKWCHAISLMNDMHSGRIDADRVAFNALITSLRSEWPLALHFLRNMSSEHMDPDVISYSASLSSLEEGSAWEQSLALFREMERHGDDFFDDFSYNAVIGAFSRASEWTHALHVLSKKERRFPVDIHACSAAVSACERAGQWQHVLNLWPRLQLVQEKANDLQKKLYEVSASGPEHITRHLRAALELQWVVGYPFLPAQEDQLTHGFYKYIAGMQALCARELLQLVPEAQHVMDMFCGSGTVLIEALRAGKDATGCDVSPLALLVATHHTDARDIDVMEFLRVAETLADSAQSDWRCLKAEIAHVEQRGIRDALHFVLLCALSRAGDVTYLHSSSKDIQEVPQDGLPPAMFKGLARLYVARVQSLREQRCAAQCQIHRCDNRILRLPEPVDAIVTGPPYPGVYDYHSPASSCGQFLGEIYDFCAPGFSISGLKAPTEREVSDKSSDYAPKKEIGQNSLWLREGDFEASWQAEQEAWLRSAFANLKEEGTATLMIGDGDVASTGDGGFDNLEPTLAAAEMAGFEPLATASIRSRSRHPKQPRGMKRTEHMVHLKKPR